MRWQLGQRISVLVALKLIEELRRNVHVASLTGAAPHRDHRDAAASREDHLVATAEITVDGADELVAPARGRARSRPTGADRGLAQRLRLGVARSR